MNEIRKVLTWHVLAIALNFFIVGLGFMVPSVGWIYASLAVIGGITGGITGQWAKNRLRPIELVGFLLVVVILYLNIAYVVSLFT